MIDHDRISLAKRVCWCKAVIRHEAMKAKRKYDRWAREPLTLNQLSIRGEEFVESLQCPIAQQDFQDIEMRILLESLPTQEFAVLYHLFYLRETEQYVARVLHMSQPQVSRTKKQALYALRREVDANEL